MNNKNINLYNDDCLNVLKALPDNSINMFFTSPPYADRRKGTYGGEKANKYINWFLPIAKEIKRTLHTNGSFFLNIKPHTENGERVLYVMKLIIALKEELNFYFVDELCWTKTAFPGNYNGRLKNGFEPIYHFSKINPNKITFNPVACGTPITIESIKRSYRKQCGKPKNGSGMTSMNTTNIRNLKLSRPSNVIHINNTSNQHTTYKSKHPATFPTKLSVFFVKTYSNENDLICDPFMGSGTTGISCLDNNRKFLGIELKKEYYDLSKERLENYKSKYTPIDNVNNDLFN